jgi:hypothetical protein
MNYLQLFFNAIDNYHLYNETKLIKYGVKVCLSDEENEVEKYYIKFSKKVVESELHGTLDLIDPIIKAYNTKEY